MEIIQEPNFLNNKRSLFKIKRPNFPQNLILMLFRMVKVF